LRTGVGRARTGRMVSSTCARHTLAMLPSAPQTKGADREVSSVVVHVCYAW
jgi:hypothetical protein